MNRPNYKAICTRQRKEIKELKAMLAELALLLTDPEYTIEPEWIYAKSEPAGNPDRDAARRYIC